MHRAAPLQPPLFGLLLRELDETRKRLAEETLLVDRATRARRRHPRLSPAHPRVADPSHVTAGALRRHQTLASACCARARTTALARPPSTREHHKVLYRVCARSAEALAVGAGAHRTDCAQVCTASGLAVGAPLHRRYASLWGPDQRTAAGAGKLAASGRAPAERPGPAPAASVPVAGAEIGACGGGGRGRHSASAPPTGRLAGPHQPARRPGSRTDHGAEWRSPRGLTGIALAGPRGACAGRGVVYDRFLRWVKSSGAGGIAESRGSLGPDSHTGEPQGAAALLPAPSRHDAQTRGRPPDVPLAMLRLLETRRNAGRRVIRTPER